MDEAFKQRLFDFFEKRYNFELDLKEKIAGRLAFTLGVITIVGNILLYYANNLLSKTSQAALEHPWLVKVNDYSLICAASLLACSIVAFLRSLGLGFPFGHLYGSIPEPDKIASFVTLAEDYNGKVRAPQKMKLPDEFNERLLRQYVDYGSVNARSNRTRQKNLTWTIGLAVASATVLIFFVTPVFFLLKQNGEKPSHLIEISKPIKIEQDEPRTKKRFRRESERRSGSPAGPRRGQQPPGDFVRANTTQIS